MNKLFSNLTCVKLSEVNFKQKILNSIYDGDIPSELNDKLNFLSKRLSLTSDTIGMKKIIGEKVVEAGGYPVQSF